MVFFQKKVVCKLFPIKSIRIVFLFSTNQGKAVFCLHFSYNVDLLNLNVNVDTDLNISCHKPDFIYLKTESYAKKQFLKFEATLSLSI